MNRLATLLLGAVLGGALALGAGACTSNPSSPRDAGGDDAVAPHDGGAPDSGVPCSLNELAAVDSLAQAGSSALGFSAFSSATEPYDYLSIELYYGLGGVEPLTGPGTVTIGAGAGEDNYATCATCVLIYAGCDGASCARSFFATSGTLTVTALATGGRFTGTLTDARLVEVTIDASTFASTPVAGGDTWCLASFAFDTALEGSLPCAASAECAGTPATPYCDTTASACVQCLEESHCSALTATPHCDPGSFACVECVTSAHCAASSYGAYCVDGQCGACANDFDCADASTPVCTTDDATYRTVCGVGGTCAGDDAGEPGDDGPAGARTLVAGATATGAICAAADAAESDFHELAVVATGNVTLTLTWTITNSSDAEDLDLYVYTAAGELLGKSEFGAGSETVALTYLGAGIHYVKVVAYDMGTAVAPIPYTLSAVYAAATCSSAADCAASYGSQYLRGSCAGGACAFIAGHGALPADAACDSLDDCASGLCTYGGYATDLYSYFIDYHFMADSSTRGYCVAAQCLADSDCASPKVCSLGFCLPRCSADAQCPVAGPGDTVTLDNWTHAQCNTTTGACEF